MRASNSLYSSAILLIIILGSLIGCLPDQYYISTDTSVIINNAEATEINVYVADDNTERMVGLGSVEVLAKNEGMLFLYEEDHIPAFWMKGVEYPIDIVWLLDLEIIEITPDVQPEASGTVLTEYRKYQPNQPINAVLELPAGTIAAEGIAVGQRLDIRF